MNRHNNFDLIRLLAALEVLRIHLIDLGLLTLPAHHLITRLFPAVVTFFVVSGFLITSSLVERPHLSRYLRSRALRMLPALAVSLGLVGVLGWNILSPQVANPPLWTIPLEAGFYLVMALFAFLPPLFMVGLMGLSLVFHAYGAPGYWPGDTLYYFWAFGLGALARLHWAVLARWVEGKFWVWLPAYVVFYLGFAHAHLVPVWATDLVLQVPLAGTLLALAFSFPALSRGLKGQDISYGLYLYHYPLLLTFGAWGVPLAFLTAWASWRWVEKPALGLKR